MQKASMTVEVLEDESRDWAGYAAVPIAFTVRAILQLASPAVGERSTERTGADSPEAFELRPILPAYEKDYDREPGEHPIDWPRRFDVARWGVLVARAEGQRIGGAVIAVQTDPTLELLRDRPTGALLWDVRVTPSMRGRGVGQSLFRASEQWANARGFTELVIETQDTNVPACRFYARMGCTLEAIIPGIYPTLPHETQLLWRRALDLRSHAA
jgi:GNAT superfamily N-acetyltransferase